VIDHGGDTLTVFEYFELLESVENAGCGDYIEHSFLSRGFLLIDEDNIKEIHQDRIEGLVKDCYLNGQELPSFIEIDWEATAENCSRYDGYGHEFSGYDGSEELIHGFYIFCTN
jgi:hypothetical protein